MAVTLSVFFPYLPVSISLWDRLAVIIVSADSAEAFHPFPALG